MFKDTNHFFLKMFGEKLKRPVGFICIVERTVNLKIWSKVNANATAIVSKYVKQLVHQDIYFRIS